MGFESLFAQKHGVKILLEGLFVHIPDGKKCLCIHDDAVLVYLLNLMEVNNIGTVDAHEVSG